MRIARTVVLFALATSLLGCGVGAHGNGHGRSNHPRRRARDGVFVVKAAIVLIDLAVRAIEAATERSSVANRNSGDARDSWEPPPSSWSTPPSTGTATPPRSASSSASSASSASGTPAASRFDQAAARTALSGARVVECRDRGVPRGYVRASTTFASSGAVSAVAVEEPSTLSDTARACVEERLRIAMVPPFDGAEVTARASWFVP